MDEQVGTTTDLKIGDTDLASRSRVEGRVLTLDLKGDDAKRSPGDLRGGHDGSTGGTSSSKTSEVDGTDRDGLVGSTSSEVVDEAACTWTDSLVGLKRGDAVSNTSGQVEGDADQPTDAWGRLGGEGKPTNTIDKSLVNGSGRLEVGV